MIIPNNNPNLYIVYARYADDCSEVESMFLEPVIAFKYVNDGKFEEVRPLTIDPDSIDDDPILYDRSIDQWSVGDEFGIGFESLEEHLMYELIYGTNEELSIG